MLFLNYLGLIRCKDENLFTKYHCVFKKSSTFAELLKSSAIEASFGEMAEWSIAAVLKTVELRGSGGSNPSLSATKGVNLAVMRFTPFFLSPKVKGRE